MQHFSKLHDLLVIWGESCYFSSALITTLQETIEDASTGNVTSTKDIKYSGELGGARDFGGDTRRDAPYTMPASHGDTSIPFYDLPTGNLMPCIEPNLMTPINPRSVYPLQFRVGPAEERLVQAVKCLLQNADFIYSANRSVNATEKSYINDLGQLVIYEKHSGEPTANEGYYGWSKAFCERRKLPSRHDMLPGSTHRQPSPESMSRRGGRALCPAASTSRSSSPATSRTPARDEKITHIQRQWTNSDSGSRSRSKPRYFDRHRSSAIIPRPRSTSSQSRSRSYSPPDIAVPEDCQTGRERNTLPKPFNDGFSHAVVPPPASFQRNLFGQLPIPPPPPPNYSGPWVSACHASPKA